uniref:VWFA domain-containing protein n=1 Tax=Alexandrium catenella TaxID=2925 RepID=A0A7S1M5J9_ALECA
MQHEELKQAMLTMRNSCSSKFRGLESELCALKKIRGELNKMKGDKHPFFQDCEVAEKWEEKECSASCGGGTQELTRAIITPPSGGGAQCPPTKQVQTCNEQPCPINCKMSQWSGFSACSAGCGGGVSQRSREIKVQPRYEGDPCGETSEAIPCNMQACDKDCGLVKWTPWSECSKACDSGTRTRRRTVKHAAVGRGECPAVDSPERLERKKCNEQPCIRDKSMPLMCSTKLDLVLALDGSGSVGSSGWEATKKFAAMFLKAFEGQGADAQVSLILFSGPYSYSQMRKCAGSGAGLDMAKDCKVSMVQHFSSDVKSTQASLAKLAWPRGTTLTSQALELAHSELTLGRADAEKVVLVITDGIPVSSRATSMSAKRLREKARLMFGAVKLGKRGLRYMVNWGSKPTKENVLKIQSFQDLESLDTVDTLVTDMCKNITVPTSATLAVTIR